jgi:PTH2 family peptidyl-tRNA hydrolase
MKQVIVVRKDLKLSPGKLAVQVSHASVSAAAICQTKNKAWFMSWTKEGQKKVVLQTSDEKQLLSLKAKADSLKLPSVLIRDAGLTEIPAGTVTALGIGPAPDSELDKVTGSLPLL